MEDKIIKLNIGGVHLETKKQTLNADKESILAKMVSGQFEDEDKEEFFIDRDERHFHHILNFLRCATLPDKVIYESGDELLTEADYYNIQGLVRLIKDRKDGWHYPGESTLQSLKSYGLLPFQIRLVFKDGKAVFTGYTTLKQADYGTVLRRFCSKLEEEATEFNSAKTCDTFYVDRNSTNFQYILQYLRDKELPDNVKRDLRNDLLVEAEYYGITGMKNYLREAWQQRKFMQAQGSFVKQICNMK